jgi:hypothetical protein
MDDEFGAMAFGGFDDLWKRHGGKGALRHGGTVSMIEKFRTRLLTQPSRLIDAAGEAAVADDVAAGIAAIFRAPVIAPSSTAHLGIKTCCDCSVSV